MPVGSTRLTFSSPLANAPSAGTSSSDGFASVAVRAVSPAKVKAACSPRRRPSIAPGTPLHSASK